jgi:hypothetical protein
MNHLTRCEPARHMLMSAALEAHMGTSLNQLIRIALLLTATAAALVLFPVTAHASSNFRRAIEAGVAGAAAGDVAGNALAGSMPPRGYYPPPYPAPMPNCTDELFQKRGAYSYWIGQRRVCH